jgi:hypothetical protein
MIYLIVLDKENFDVYQPRNPKAIAYYRCVEDQFEQLDAVWLPARRSTAPRVIFKILIPKWLFCPGFDGGRGCKLTFFLCIP